MQRQNCEITVVANLQVLTEAGTGNDMRHSSTDTTLSFP